MPRFGEAVENVDTVLTNLLKCQARMETIREKLYELEDQDSEEAVTNPSNISIAMLAWYLISFIASLSATHLNH